MTSNRSSDQASNQAMQIAPKLMTVCLLIEGNKVLLGLKKRGFGANRWNGFGGKVHAGETIEQAAIREMREEAGITVSNLEPRGQLTFKTKDRPQDFLMHIFVARSHSGEPTESEEMRPQWFEISKIPLDQMWSSDTYWMPQIIAQNKKVIGEFTFDAHDQVIDQKITLENF